MSLAEVATKNQELFFIDKLLDSFPVRLEFLPSLRGPGTMTPELFPWGLTWTQEELRIMAK